MNIGEVVVLQSSILALFAVLGIIFTFVLPKPTHALKAKSAVFARFFLALSCIGFMFLCLRHVGYHKLANSGHNVLMLAGLYALFVTVCCRFGRPLLAKEKYVIVGHVVLCELATLFFVFLYPSVIARDVILSISALVPMLLALKQIRRYRRKESLGDRALLFLLSATLLFFVLYAPIRVTFLPKESLAVTTATFFAVFLLMSLFILTFAISVMDSLIQRLKKQVHIDALTGCKNRHFFSLMAPKLVALAKRNKQVLSVVVCDIDYFKSINDKFGHVVGDRALVEFSELLKEELREEDMLVRMGGEEFLILSPNVRLSDAQSMAERLRKKVCRHTITCQDKSFSLTASFGVICLSPEANIYDGIKKADEALYEAKTGGRNQVICVNF